jgi:RimJ/RimL family protein N-acetyltransferase
MPFYPDDALVPETKRTERLLLRPLRAIDVELDYDAVMSSAEQLRRWSQSSWPADDFTLAENLADLQRHEREHAERVAFTFTVLDPQAQRCLGCVYLTPPHSQTAPLCAGAAYPANVGFWVRTSELANELDAHLLATLREWLAAEWAFDCLVWGISQQEVRQAALLRQVGMELRQEFTSANGRAGWAFL